MKLLGAGVSFSNTESGRVPSGFQFSSSILFDEIMAIDYAVSASKVALDNAYFTSNDIDLIISISASPSHLSDASHIIGPRLGHPIQRELGAKNAVVLDLLASDWSFAIDVAYGFCLAQNLSTVLIVRAESTAGVAGGNDNLVPVDGSGALLLGLPQYKTWQVSYHDIPMQKVKAIHVAGEEGIFLSRSFSITNDDFTLLESATQKVVLDLINHNEIEGKAFIYEVSVEGQGLATCIEKMGGAVFDGLDISHVGSFGLPLALAAWQSSPGAETEFYGISFDPYKARQACYLLEM